MHACGGTAGWGEAIKCGTMFLGDSKIVIRYGDPEAGSAPNVGIVGLNPSEPILVTLHPRFAAIYEGWFWGRDIYVYHTYVNADGVHGGGTITVSH